MKVTVSFGAVRVVVPCGSGDITVTELMDKSVQRYRKATGRTDDYWVRIKSLKSEGEDGILDVDDLVCDVADDREKLIAIFDEQDRPRPSGHLILDGTSTCTSSVGTASPLLNFNSLDTNGQMNNSNNKMMSSHYGDFDEPSEVDVVVTGDEISTDPKLHVRRGSDPIIPIMNGDPQKWNNDPETDIDSNANTLPDKKPSQVIIEKRRGSKDELSSAFSRFGRDSSRQSISGTLQNNMYKWAEAQEKTQNETNGRKDSEEGNDDMEREKIIIKNDGTPLGIQIIARVENDDDSAYGLVIHGIETGGRAARDGRLRQGDHILTINKLDITEMTFDGAQELLRDAMRTESVTLTVEREQQPSDDNQNHSVESSRVPPDVPARAPATSLSKEESQSQKVHNIIAPTNTRRIGRKLYVQLMKGPQGLGFSITTRDNAVGGKNPIYIKNILPKGAAIADGRCKPGDRLLEVNGIEMTGKTQSEAVSILRSVRLGGVVNLVLSRQDSGSTAATPEKVLPRELPEEKTTDDPTNAKNKAVVVFDIPLNDTGSAGLGVSVKGKTSGNGTDGETKDLGIFIKSVIHGGAASKDGRLRPNDQLLYINDESLISISNSSAMDILRRSMAGDKSPRSHIRLVIARRTDPGDVTPTSSRPSDHGIETKAESIDGEGRPGSPVSISSRGVELDMEAMDELFKHPVLNKLNALEKEQLLNRHVGPGGDGFAEDTSQLSPTMPKGGEEIVMIDDADIDDAIAKIAAASPSASGRAPSPPQWLVDTWEKARDEEGESSPVDDPYNQFQRDSFARRSFSERHKGGGSLDTKQMAWYKKKGGPEPPKVPPKTVHHPKGSPQHKDIAISTGSLVRSNSTDNLKDTPNLSSIHHLTAEERRDIGPFLGLKKNSSLESLQAAVAEVTTHDDLSSRPRAKVVRGRGCNESFRAAVDRSYDQPLNGNAINSVDTGSEFRENGHIQVRDDRSSKDDHSSISSHDPVIMSQTGGTSKKRKEKEKEKDKRKSSTFKGFGSMFRFGKNRKPDRDGRPAEERQRSNSVSSEKSRLEEIEKYKEQQEEQSSRIQDEVRKHRENQSLRRQKEESLEARNKAERMQELRQKYQRDHRERQGRYVDDVIGDEEARDEDRRSGDREDEGYGDGSPSSPRSPRPYSPHRETTDSHAPEYRDRDHDRWERQSDGNPRSSRHHDDTRLHDERRYDERSRHNGRRSVPPYIESRNRDEHHDRRRETHTTAEVEMEPKYATVNRKARPDRNSESSMRDKHNDRNKPEKIYASHYESVERRERTDRDPPKRNPDKIYESVEFQRPPRVSDRHRDERNREDRHRNERNPEEWHRDDRFYEDRHREDRNRDERYKEDRYRDERYRGERHGDRPDGRRVERRPEREKKHNDPDKIKNSDTLRKKESETLKESDSYNPKEKEALKRKESDTLKRKGSEKTSKKADKSKAKETEKKETDKKEKEESKLTRRKSDKKKDEKEKDKKKEKAKSKDEKVSSEEEKTEERNVDSRRDRRDENDRRDARRGDTLDRRHRGEKEGGDGRDRRRDDGRRDTRDRQRSPPPSDKYGYGSLGRPHRKRTTNDPNQHNRGTRESGYQSDHDRHRPDHNHDNHTSSNYKGYANGPTANHYPDERRPRMTSTQSVDRHHDGYYGKEDYGSSSNHQSRTGRRMHYSESGLDYEERDAARV
ncbi:partitioning defective 3 homolog isoform X1 [Asterias rubens]|uniref:partitioning defective 3 homolog isoform X1 n=1 Tax=Asterias rubens TaxID=7604 RepID=UPI0014553840|nr:partitioning defective 3 homolog isoform X1 [Asterias rubens]XP_033639267.1 partitioning defective 3 homolog isoform X1 [Asterias rubens]